MTCDAWRVQRALAGHRAQQCRVFTLHEPPEIALSLQRSAERSHRRKVEPFRSAMSMLTFHINRASLPGEQGACLEAAKKELRALYGKLQR